MFNFNRSNYRFWLLRFFKNVRAFDFLTFFSEIFIFLVIFRNIQILKNFNSKYSNI